MPSKKPVRKSAKPTRKTAGKSQGIKVTPHRKRDVRSANVMEELLNYIDQNSTMPPHIQSKTYSKSYSKRKTAPAVEFQDGESLSDFLARTNPKPAAAAEHNSETDREFFMAILLRYHGLKDTVASTHNLVHLYGLLTVILSALAVWGIWHG